MKLRALRCDRDLEDHPRTSKKLRFRRNFTATTMLQLLPKLAAAAAPYVLKTLLPAAASSTFTATNRPAPNYPGHVPLTTVERIGMAVGSAVGSFLDPRRGGALSSPASQTELTGR